LDIVTCTVDKTTRVFCITSIGNREDIRQVSLLIMDRKIDLSRRLVILFYSYSSGKIAETKDVEWDQMDASP